MKFKYTATLWVEPSDIEEMLKLCHQGYTYEQLPQAGEMLIIMQ